MVADESRTLVAMFEWILAIKMELNGGSVPGLPTDRTVTGYKHDK